MRAMREKEEKKKEELECKEQRRKEKEEKRNEKFVASERRRKEREKRKLEEQQKKKDATVEGSASKCSQETCLHSRARTWVMCAECQLWFHCICMGVPSKIASKENYVFHCPKCSHI